MTPYEQMLKLSPPIGWVRYVLGCRSMSSFGAIIRTPRGSLRGSHLPIVCTSVEVYTVVKEAICIAHTGILHLIDTIIS